MTSWPRSTPIRQTRLLVDENLSGDLVRRLEALDYDVVWVRRAFQGATDRQIVEIAREDTRVIMTRDKGFGDLVFHQARRVPVILLRIDESTPAHELIELIAQVIDRRDDWSQFFSVIERDRIRSIPLARDA